MTAAKVCPLDLVEGRLSLCFDDPEECSRKENEKEPSPPPQPPQVSVENIDGPLQQQQNLFGISSSWRSQLPNVPAAWFPRTASDTAEDGKSASMGPSTTSASLVPNSPSLASAVPTAVSLAGCMFRTGSTDERRNSGFAVDLNIRAELHFEETCRLLEGAFDGAPPGPDAGSWRDWVRKVIFSRSIARFLRTLGVFSTLLGPLLLAMEPSCEEVVQVFDRTIRERSAVVFVKWVHFVCSIFYLVLSVGQMSIMDWEPLRLLSRSPTKVRQSFNRASRLNSLSSMDLDERLRQKGGPVRFPHPPRKDRRFRSLEWLVIDLSVAVSLPAELIHLFETPVDVPSFTQWFWLLNVCKAWRFLKPTTERRDSQDGFWMQILHLAISLFLFTHLIACIFALTASLEVQRGTTSWADDVASLTNDVRSCSDFYMAAFYFAAYTVTSIGHGDIVPMNTLERGIDSFIMIISQMYVAKVFADLNFIISTHNYWVAQRHQRLRQTAAALKSMGAPRTVRQRVFAYQDFIWEVQKERRAKECMRDLSDNLREELQTVVYQRLVTQAPFLQQLSIPALRHIISSLTDTISLPSDFIVRRGAEGSELYFLREGCAGVFLGKKAPSWTDLEVKVVHGGDYFGEVALLTGQKRSSWVMARTYCVCSLLHKRAIDEVLAADPGCIVTLTVSMKEALNLKAQISWEEVGNRLNRLFVDLVELQQFLVHCQTQRTSSTSLTAQADLITNVSWVQYQALMQQLRVPILDQKLLWIDLDETEIGSSTWKHFVEVAYSGSRCEEAEDLAALYENADSVLPTDSTRTGNARDSLEGHPQRRRQTSEHRRSGAGCDRAGNSFLSVQHAWSHGGNWNRDSKRNDSKRNDSKGPRKDLQTQITQLGDKFDERMDVLNTQVARLTSAVISLGATLPDEDALGPRPGADTIAAVF